MALRTTSARHGGDLDCIAREYGIAPDRLLDFSASINPAGPPVRAMRRLAREAANPALLTRYPDPEYWELRSALAGMLAVPPAAVTIANGAAALIAAVVRVIEPHECVLATPAFAEYARALHAGGCSVRCFRMAADLAFVIDVDALTTVLRRCRPRLCVVTNPHSPSGVLMPRSQMLPILSCARGTGTVLLIDEAFIDFAPGETLSAEAVSGDHLVVLRSLTKFYGMPALRVGYSVSSPTFAGRVAAELPPWAVTTLAASAATEAVHDPVYARRTRTFVAEQRRWLTRGLEAIGATVYPSAANFLLLQLPESAPTSTEIRERLIIRHSVVVRDCRTFDGLSNGRFIRVAVRRRDENEQLVRALRSVVKGES